MANNSIKGFKVGNEVRKYDYNELDNLPENDPDDLAEEVNDLKSDIDSLENTSIKAQSELLTTGIGMQRVSKFMLNVNNPIVSGEVIGDLYMVLHNPVTQHTTPIQIDLATVNSEGLYTVYDSITVQITVTGLPGDIVKVLSINKKAVGNTYCFIKSGGNLNVFSAAINANAKLVVSNDESESSFTTREVTGYEICYLFYCGITHDFVKKVVTDISVRTVYVDSNGYGDYTNITDAVSSEPEGTVIYVMPGVYEGTVQAFQKRVILIGTDRNKCILKSTDGRYEYPAINASCGYIENLTILSEYVNGVSNDIGPTTSGAYALHCENEYGTANVLEIHHCTLKSDFFPAVGCGLRKDFHMIIDDCELINNQISGRGNYSVNDGSLGALYFHDSNGAQGDQYITLKNCVLKSSLGNSMTPYQVDRTPQENHVYCEFINNVLHDKINGYLNNVWFRGDPFNANTGIFELKIGYGNSNSTLNN